MNSSRIKRDFYFAYDNQPLDNGVVYHIVLTHAAGQPAISGEVSVNGCSFCTHHCQEFLSGRITNFQIDMISISSYQNVGLAIHFQHHRHRGQFCCSHFHRRRFKTRLARSATTSGWRNSSARATGFTHCNARRDFQSWGNVPASTSIAGNGIPIYFLPDNNPPPYKSFLPHPCRQAMSSIQTICQPEKCPLCDQPNDCQLCTHKPPTKVRAGASTAKIPDELIARVTPELQKKACIRRILRGRIPQ